MINHLMSGRCSSVDMHDSSLGLIQFHDHHQYMYGSSTGPFLPHHHGFISAEEDRCIGKVVPELVEPATAGVAEEVEFGACKEGEDVAVVGQERQEDAPKQGEEEKEAHGVRMIALLMECAVAMSVGNLADANGTLLELSQMASPYAPSCGERLVAYFARAMAARLMSSWVGVCAPVHPSSASSWSGVHAAFRAFYNVAPFVRCAYLACNQAILEAFRGKRLVHVIDLDVVPGGALQWLSLLSALAARPGGPPVLRVTGFGVSASALHDAGTQLAGLAIKLGMPFEFYAVVKRPGDVVDAVADLPSRRPGEVVAVHWLRHALYDAAGDDVVTMRLVRWLEPKVVTLVEQERGPAGGDGGQFLDRFVAALHHYSAVFDALGAARPADGDASRHLVENSVLGREIGNVLAVAGPTRSGREMFGSWQAELARNGFMRAGAAGGRAQVLAGACPAGLGYTVADDHDGTVRLGWKGTPLYAVSTWTCCTTHHARP
uniref:Protein SCARECROW n=1 Tax=Hordeum vulgare subsp. vulgare TaxID=112509 RepID=A0A8I6WKL0_HORVV